ncbi:N-acetyltransferase [Camelimonas fluminis]|uniref:GNAT family N-acetyltransferase n=1 Tax=Camelimonas fluminis TaxID=1576911 RepID=A0ABV7UIQ1_9HYPH|nr:GNAT family N-acetyltransferase [Camelimonas fluminis]GHE72721.1 N-acetyltransferase [Camelimonas fluminis]
MTTAHIVNLRDKPELADTTGAWRWEAFFKDGPEPRAGLIARERDCARGTGHLPTVLVLLAASRPAGMIALCLDDIEGRPELNPWLAGLYVDPEFRGAGYGRQLVEELEAFAAANCIHQLSLYTSNASGLFASLGWKTVETFDEGGKQFSIMRKRLG